MRKLNAAEQNMTCTLSSHCCGMSNLFCLVNYDIVLLILYCGLSQGHLKMYLSSLHPFNNSSLVDMNYNG